MIGRQTDRYAWFRNSCCYHPPGQPPGQNRGIEWSLRAFASTRALRIFLRARAVINFFLPAASTQENRTSEQRTLHKFSANFTRRFIT